MIIHLKGFFLVFFKALPSPQTLRRNGLIIGDNDWNSEHAGRNDSSATGFNLESNPDSRVKTLFGLEKIRSSSSLFHSASLIFLSFFPSTLNLQN